MLYKSDLQNHIEFCHFFGNIRFNLNEIMKLIAIYNMIEKEEVELFDDVFFPNIAL